MSAETTRIIVESASTNDALRALYQHRKERGSSISYAMIGRKLGLKSKGSVHGLLCGRHKIRAKHADPICELFKLDSFEAEYFRSRVLWEAEHDPEQKAVLSRRIGATKKILTAKRIPLAAECLIARQKLACDVFCSIAILGDGVLKSKLKTFFRTFPAGEVEEAITLLAERGLVSERERRIYCDQRLALLQNNDGTSPEDLVRSYLEEASSKVAEWFGRPQDAYFQSFTVAVRQDDYRRALQKIKKCFQTEQASLQTDSGDAVVRFNAQIYPVACLDSDPL